MLYKTNSVLIFPLNTRRSKQKCLGTNFLMLLLFSTYHFPRSVVHYNVHCCSMSKHSFTADRQPLMTQWKHCRRTTVTLRSTSVVTGSRSRACSLLTKDAVLCTWTTIPTTALKGQWRMLSPVQLEMQAFITCFKVTCAMWFNTILLLLFFFWIFFLLFLCG